MAVLDYILVFVAGARENRRIVGLWVHEQVGIVSLGMDEGKDVYQLKGTVLGPEGIAERSELFWGLLEVAGLYGCDAHL